jgi:ribosomal protein L11 methylase PrmA
LTDKIEVASLTEAGQGDAMPRAGLRLGRVHVVCAGLPEPEVAAASAGCDGVVRLGNSANGWGTGCHPTTRLCVEFLSEQLVGGETVLDYGTGR